jgi:hypothetical protein
VVRETFELDIIIYLPLVIANLQNDLVNKVTIKNYFDKEEIKKIELINC